MTQRVEPKPGPGLRAFSALRHVQYRWYWFSGLSMTAAQGILQLAIAWLVLDLTGSVGQLGLVVFIQGVPMAIASFYGGVLADRYNRRNILVLAQTVTMLDLTALAILTAGDMVQIWHVYLSSIGLGLMQAVTMPARNALIRSLVDESDMLNAVALNAVQFHSSRIIWPSLAGGLITLAGVGVTLGLSAACSFSGIVFLLMIRKLKDDGEAHPVRSSQFRQMAEGVRYAFTEPGVATVMLLSLCCGLFGLSYMNLAPAFAREELELGASGAGFFMMSMGVGAIVGSALLLVFPVKDGRQLFITLTAGFGIVILTQAVNPWFPAAFVVMGLFGLVSAVLVVAGQTFLQINVPQHLLGRLVGLWSLAGGLGFITALPIGLLGDEVGLRWSMGGAAALLIVSTVWFGFVSQRERRVAEEATPAAS
ncbi:MAG TPA: MFS transporter [Dehalococcoidia bacterium]|nr:MFS transporter [Dehalococcoidia bacterium]